MQHSSGLNTDPCGTPDLTWVTEHITLSDRYERGYFHKIWMECYCLGENHGSGTLSLKFVRRQNPYQL